MKKIFTLIAVAVMAISVNAQGSFGLIKESGVITAGSKVTSVDNITLTFGDAGAADFKDPKGDNKLQTLLGATGFTEGNGTNGNAANGTIYYFEPTINGVLTVGAVINSDKKILVKKDSYSGDDVAFKVTEADGTTEVTVTDGKIAAKTYGAIIFNVIAGTKYAVGLSGSKMGFYGFKFAAGGVNSITSLQADDAENAAAYNVAGQKVGKDYKGLVIKNGKKYVIK